MLTSPAEIGALLEAPLAAVETRLRALGHALVAHDAPAIEHEAAELHLALASAVDHFGRAARHGGVPPPLRQRLALASAQVAAQRQALARATAALDRAIDVLLPGSHPGNLYSAAGAAERAAGSGNLVA